MLQNYLDSIKSGSIIHIPEQEEAIKKAEAIINNFIDNKKASFWKKFFIKQNHKKWIYLYGGVGQGKTLITKIISQKIIPILDVIEIHFSRLLNILETQQKIEKYDVIIIDEFEILDIVASKLIRDFLFINQDKMVIFTSNKAPNELYKNGLQRQMFLPAIDLIKNRAIICLLDIGRDLRSKIIKTEGNFTYFDNIDASHSVMYYNFLEYCKGEKILEKEINVHGRKIFVKIASKRNAYFEFNFLFNNSLGVNDYKAICETFKTIFISGFHQIDSEDTDIARRFINFMDIAYANSILLKIGFCFDFKELIKLKNKIPEMERAISRLMEMQ